MESKEKITVKASINAPLQKVWEFYVLPEHIIHWNAASDDWHTPKATNDAVTGGKFSYRMEARDGSMGFDFEGVYDEVRDHELIAYSLGDGRSVETTFTEHDGNTEVITRFDAENIHSDELQRQGWQAILDNFKKYTEHH